MPLDHMSLDSGFRRSDEQSNYFIVIPAQAGIQNMSDVQTILVLLVTQLSVLFAMRLSTSSHIFWTMFSTPLQGNSITVFRFTNASTTLGW